MLRIRRMEPEDCAAAAELEERTFSRPWSREAFASTAQRADSCCLVAEEDGALTGYVIALFALDEGEIENVCVAERHRRQGTATALLSALCKEAAARGVLALYLEVRVSNAAARSLYRKFLFEEIGLRKGFYEAPREDAVLMRRTADGKACDSNSHWQNGRNSL